MGTEVNQAPRTDFQSGGRLFMDMVHHISARTGKETVEIGPKNGFSILTEFHMKTLWYFLKLWLTKGK